MTRSADARHRIATASMFSSRERDRPGL